MSPLQILMEDNHLIAINKRPGDISQGDKTGDSPIGEEVKAYLRTTYQKPGNIYLGVVHRLDRPVSGVLLFAKTGKAAERLSSAIQQREIKKTYLVVTGNRPPEPAGHLEHHLLKNEKQNKSYICQPGKKGAKAASLKYRLLGESERYFLLEVELITGRHHQIRAQLAHIGCPVKGDLKYGSKRSNPDGSIHLHAWKLQLEHPVKKETLIIQAAPPDETIWNLFQPE
jgi:23S rRNA pseudouridine1911/1915/1917 synthase